MTKFDDLPSETQGKGMAAVMKFLKDNGYVNLGEASKALDCPHQMIWDKITAEAGLPECEPPQFIEVGELVYTILKDAWDDIQWPRFVPVPEPGQSIEDDECGWVSVHIATASDIETFLAAEPDWTEKPDWCTPLTIMGLKFIVGYAKQEKVGPDESLLRALGMVTEH